MNKDANLGHLLTQTSILIFTIDHFSKCNLSCPQRRL